MSYKKRTKEEVELILKELGSGLSRAEICMKHSISSTALHRLIADNAGVQPEKRKVESKIKKLEKIIAQQELEIKLMKAALKKS